MRGFEDFGCVKERLLGRGRNKFWQPFLTALAKVNFGSGRIGDYSPLVAVMSLLLVNCAEYPRNSHELVFDLDGLFTYLVSYCCAKNGLPTTAFIIFRSNGFSIN